MCAPEHDQVITHHYSYPSSPYIYPSVLESIAFGMTDLFAFIPPSNTFDIAILLYCTIPLPTGVLYKRHHTVKNIWQDVGFFKLRSLLSTLLPHGWSLDLPPKQSFIEFVFFVFFFSLHLFGVWVVSGFTSEIPGKLHIECVAMLVSTDEQGVMTPT